MTNVQSIRGFLMTPRPFGHLPNAALGRATQHGHRSRGRIKHNDREAGRPRVPKTRAALAPSANANRPSLVVSGVVYVVRGDGRPWGHDSAVLAPGWTGGFLCSCRLTKAASGQYGENDRFHSFLLV